MNAPLVRHAECGRYCGLVRPFGFIVEDGCPVHEGRTWFPVCWVENVPVCGGHMFFVSPDGTQMVTVSFVMGLS